MEERVTGNRRPRTEQRLDAVASWEQLYRTRRLQEVERVVALAMEREGRIFRRDHLESVAFVLEQASQWEQPPHIQELFDEYLHRALLMVGDSPTVAPLKTALTQHLGCAPATDSEVNALVAGYNREAAVAYANRYYKNHNPRYPDFNSRPGRGGNCANFISQCLYAGGMPWVLGPPERFTWTRYWWCKPGATDRDGDQRITLSWKVTVAFRNHWSGRVARFSTHSAAAMLNDWSRWFNRLRLGDFIQLAYANGAPYHTLILVAKVGNDIALASQSDDANDQSMRGILESVQKKGERVLVYEMGD
ncbi:hypothetical protein GTO89_02965 [Heliobacterium gestii]|uniref:Putative amidase domain-containing protein n=1 Tax=Heliomicrobium gestii TaxID=2699 RepID=A0A845LBV7_HELGE|nr:amidase domain-containing protein [Heliomicrobium gestii]MBM7865748.1 hypothetical protein [Heliomicrobium gestii]MZP41995.1 hypothetical protein [Heliomicrobium gestii]